MKTILEFFSSAWAQALGWTLLHTVWQAGLITLLIIVTLRFIPSRLAKLRYVVATSALVLMVLLSICTFIFLTTTIDQPKVITIQNIPINKSATPHQLLTLEPFDNNYLLLTQAYLQSYMPIIMVLWMIGAFLFSLRVAGGWFYLSKIKEVSTLLADDWSIRVNALARELKINRLISLASSPLIQVPIVFGYIKPVILIPTGMLTGLSPEQLETIFVHELMHIRRHDYLINLFQLWVEALLFFNPFVWILSSIIRREREYCCDDAVVTTYGNAMAYAKALAHLEEVRLTQTCLALSLAENKNQLLTRIKRIMEKSVKNYSGRERIIPAALLVVGLLCASWLTISTHRDDIHSTVSTDEHLLASDTTSKKKNEKSARYSRTQITTMDENGEPLEKIEENFEGDEALRPLIENSFDMSFDEGLAAIPPMPAIPDFEMELAPLAHVDFKFDSIPFPIIPNQNWELWAEEFEKKFKENFGCYSIPQKDIDKFMSDLENEFKPSVDAEVWAKNFSEDMQREEIRLQKHMKELELNQEQLMQHKAEAMRHQEKAMEALRKDQELRAKDMERIQEEHEKIAQKMEAQHKEMEETVKRFEKELKEQLVRDGYLKKDDKIKSIEWDEDTLKVNGQKIKDSDRQKYKEIHQKYFKEERWSFRFSE